jgi:hypothetical protein
VLAREKSVCARYDYRFKSASQIEGQAIQQAESERVGERHVSALHTAARTPWRGSAILPLGCKRKGLAAPNAEGQIVERS